MKKKNWNSTVPVPVRDRIYNVYLIYLYLGKTTLMYAAENGNTDIVKTLIDHGADVNHQDIRG